MYTIIGGDGQEYGPATLEQLKGWLAEGRITAETQVKKQGEDAWFALSDLPEVFNSQQAAFSSPVPLQQVEKMNHPVPVGATALLSRDYEIDVMDCFQRGFGLVKRNWKLAVVATLFFILACIVLNIPSFIGSMMAPNVASTAHSGAAHKSASVPTFVVMVSWTLKFVSSILTMLFMGPLCGGLSFFFIRLKRGENLIASDVFVGFKQSLKQLVLASVVYSLLTTLGLIFCIVPGIYLIVSYVFLFPLMLDRKMEFWEAMELSRKMVAKHWFTIGFIMLATAAVGVMGAVACGVGVIFTMPVAMATLMYAYEDIFNPGSTT